MRFRSAGAKVAEANWGFGKRFLRETGFMRSIYFGIAGGYKPSGLGQFPISIAYFSEARGNDPPPIDGPY